MPNRPSLVETLFRVKREFKPWDRNPMSVATANQLNALRDYIEHLEKQVALSSNSTVCEGTAERPVTDFAGSSSDPTSASENSSPVG